MMILQINQKFSLILYCFLSESVEQEKSWDIRWIEHLQFSQNTKQKNHRFSIVKRIKNRIFSIQWEQRTQNTKKDTRHKTQISYHHNTEENMKIYFKATAVKRKNVSVCGWHHRGKRTSKWQIERRISQVFNTGHNIFC